MPNQPDTEKRIREFAATLAKATTKLIRTDRAAYKALMAAGQGIVEQMKAGAL